MKVLVLSGGGSHGAFQAGVISTLREEYDAYCGVSVGAINAAGLAQYSDWEKAKETIVNLWKSISTKTIYKNHFPLGPLHGLWTTSLYNSSPLRKFLTKHIDVNAIKNSGKILRLGAVSLNTKQYKLFDETSENLIDAILASSAFPMMFSLPNIGGETWIDGGVRTQTPLRSAIDLGATSIDVILSSSRIKNSNLKAPKNVIDVGMRVIDAMLDEIFQTDLKCAILYNKLAVGNIAPKGKRKIPIRIIEPISSWTEDSLNFEQINIRKMMSAGQRVGKAFNSNELTIVY